MTMMIVLPTDKGEYVRHLDRMKHIPRIGEAVGATYRSRVRDVIHTGFDFSTIVVVLEPITEDEETHAYLTHSGKHRGVKGKPWSFTHNGPGMLSRAHD